MRMLCRLGVWCVCGLLAVSGVQASDSHVKESLVSLAQPSAPTDIDNKFETSIEKILSDSFLRIEHRDAPAVNGGVSGVDFSGERHRSTADRLLPGSSSLDVIGAAWARVASLRPVAAISSSSAAEILDFGPTLENSGSLVGDPVHVYSSFEILVDRDNYTLRLFAWKGNGEKTVLFFCRTGLGSPEYPTPRGSYYLCRIFDDKPMWIPPPSDWAYGESPSNNVYGGHMLPLFKKISAVGNERAFEVLGETDIVAPQMKMIDGGAYRIHGTNSPWSIGQSQSHGCVRLLNSTVKQLADTLKMYVGTTTRGKTANGSYITLARPVRVVLY